MRRKAISFGIAWVLFFTWMLPLPAGAASAAGSSGSSPGNRGEPVSYLTAAAAAAAAAVSTGTPDTSWYDASQDTFYIADADAFAGLALLTAEECDFAGRIINITEDLDLSGYENWTPVGSRTSPFAGTFDGGGHAIRGLTIQGTADDTALFGMSTGTLKNFTLYGSVSGANQTAAVAAVAGGVISGVVNWADVFASGSQAAGITAEARNGLVIDNCHNYGTIVNDTSEKSSGKLGGIAGRFEDGTLVIRNCSNEGEINGYQYVAGILGASFGEAEISGCFNGGDITARSFGKVYLGSIVGKLQSGTVDSCYNTGTLTDGHSGDGHIRAVGGIVGCEEGHPEGTAVSNCYNAGMILLNTDNMSSSKYIYMAGNISGGNQSTDANTMHYRNCYYLENTFPIQDPSCPGYERWCDVFKENPLAYDTEDVICCTAEELAKADLGKRFVKGTPYPVLFWQAGAPDPEGSAFPVTGEVTGGTCQADLPEKAVEGETVSFTVQDIEEGKQIAAIRAADEAGTELATETEEKDGTVYYRFVMPARAVTVRIILENYVPEDAPRYALALPEDLDPIWTVRAESGYYDPQTGLASAGATITLLVEKEEKAITTSLSGISVQDREGNILETAAFGIREVSGAFCYGEFRFTMPDSPAVVRLEQRFSDLTVGDDCGTEAVYSREQMADLADEGNRLYFSGWSTEADAFVGAADQYVFLEDLLQNAGVTFESGDSLRVTAADGFAQTYSYEELMGTPRSYYADILEKGTAASEAIPVKPALTITMNMTTTGDPEELVCDTLSTYRFVFGQTEAELQGAVKIVDRMPKCVTSLYVEHASAEQPAFRTHSLLLSGEIGVIFFLELPGDEELFADSYMEFSVNGKKTEVPFDPSNRNPAETYYGFTCRINAVSMADEITAVFHYGNGAAQLMETYSVVQYIETFETYRNQFDAETVRLIEALADYGHYIQIFLSEAKGWIIGEDHQEMTVFFAEDYDMNEIAEAAEEHAIVRDTGDSEISKISYALLLDSGTSIYIYLTPMEGYDGEVSALDNGRPVEAVRQTDGRLLVEVPNISAHQLGLRHRLVIRTGSGTAEVDVSALSYVDSLLRSASYAGDPDAQYAMASLYRYSEAAQLYKASH